jgi:RimJ/RimL family protein N-acetyltransferase
VEDAIETPRLRLLTMGPEFLRASLEGDRERAARLLGAVLPEGWPQQRAVLERRLEQVESDPALAPWLTRSLVLRDGARLIGISGFHGPPGGDWLRELAPDGVEFGYTVYPPWRRQGYALEAARGLIDWARARGVRRFVLSMSAQNLASVGLARRLGFSNAGSWQHEVRGMEEVYRLEVGEGPQTSTMSD